MFFFGKMQDLPEFLEAMIDRDIELLRDSEKEETYRDDTTFLSGCGIIWKVGDPPTGQRNTDRDRKSDRRPR